MNFFIQQKNRLLLVFFLVFSLWLQAQIPAGYYHDAAGKKAADLKTAMYNIIRNHTQLEYYSSSTSFKTTDWHPATASAPTGYFWDMYSNLERTSWSGMNREHSMPKSWFGIASGQENSAPIGCDLHNLYPSDKDANSAKLNYPLGEVTGTPVFNNDVVKVGTNGLSFVEGGTTLKYNSTVFEPADEYKGDFARDYMYMVTCYENYSGRWQSLGTQSMLSGGTYPVFNRWGINLLLKWSRQDPVSTKEIVRNNAVYALQKNRNPFVDHPELAEFIWGKYMDLVWTEDAVLPEDEVKFEVEPNPAQTTVAVKLNDPAKSTYFLKTMSGFTLKTDKFNAQGTIAVDKLENGLYLLEVYSSTHKRYVSKLIIRH